MTTNSMTRNGVLGQTWLVRQALTLLLSLACQGTAFAWGADDAQIAADIAKLLAIGPGSSVAEVGAGHGEMTVRMAEQVGPSGHVYATELDPDRLADIRKRVAAVGLRNTAVVAATPDSTGLVAGSCDAAYMIGVYHHLTDPVDTDRSLFAALKPGGRLLVNDFPPTLWLWLWTPKGVPDNRGGHGVADHIVVDELTRAGFEFEREISPWHSGFFIRHNYALVFRKPRAPAAVAAP